MNTFVDSLSQETLLFCIVANLKPKILPVSQMKIFHPMVPAVLCVISLE